MNRTGNASREFPMSDKPDPLKIVESDDALFDLKPDTDPKPITPIVPVGSAPESNHSDAWEDIGNRGPFVVPDDEGQVFAVDRQSPNPKTTREISKIGIRRKFGLTGKVDRTPEQEANAQLAAENGRDEKEKRRIKQGMSPNEARARRIVEDLRRGGRS